MRFEMGGKQSKQRDNQVPDLFPAKDANNKTSALPEEQVGGQKPPTTSSARDSDSQSKKKAFDYAKLPKYVNAAIGRDWLDPLSRARLLTADNKAGLATLRGEYYKTDAEKDKQLYPLLTMVLRGQPERVLELLKADPLLFFEKYKTITDPSGRTFSNVSAADLIPWIGDDDMLDKVNTFAEQLEPDELRQAFFKQWRKHLGFPDENESNQTRTRPLGGADIVMVVSDSKPKYDEIQKCTNTFNVFGDTMTAERVLLTNPDGLVCRKSSNDQLHWYYANPKTKELEPIEIKEPDTEEDKALYAELCESMLHMEPDTPTARRSSDNEHQFFETYAQIIGTKEPIKIHREGIHYQQDGIAYTDTHHDPNPLINAYLKCIRLYNAAYNTTDKDQRETLYNQADEAWRKLGREQQSLIWLLQRHCEEGRSFWPLAENYKNTAFVRTFIIDNYTTNPSVKEKVFDVKTGKFTKDFGAGDINSGFAIYKGVRGWAAVGYWWRWGVAAGRCG